MFSPKTLKTVGLALGVWLTFALSISAHDGLHEQIIAVTKKIKSSPKDPALYLKRAELYRLHEEWKNAEADFLHAERLAPNIASIELGRGKLWLDAKQYSRARIALEKYLAKQPNGFEGVVTIARVFARLQETENAVTYYTRAIQLSPKDSVEIYLERSQILAAAGKIDEALVGLDDGIKNLRGIVTLQTAAIDLEIERNKYDLALERLDKLAESMPRKETFLLRRGEILLAAGKPCEARESLIASQHGFDLLPPARRNVRAVKSRTIRIQTLLQSPAVKVCTSNR